MVFNLTMEWPPREILQLSRAWRTVWLKAWADEWTSPPKTRGMPQLKNAWWRIWVHGSPVLVKLRVCVCFLWRTIARVPNSCEASMLLWSWARREPAVSYRWTGWVSEITGWSSRLEENYRSIFRGIYRIKQNQTMSTCNRLDLESLGSGQTI